MKRADVIPAFKEGDRSDKSNYRPVSILSNLSKNFERCLYYQIEDYFDRFISKFQCGFRKGYSTQYCLTTMLEKWKKALDEGKACGALLADLSMAFEYLLHDLLITKLHAYGIDIYSFRLLLDYLSQIFQRVKIGNSYSSWLEILFEFRRDQFLVRCYLIYMFVIFFCLILMIY